ncbi:MAG: DUF3025 domain-containing protein [Burkholderiaceae bacterium]
MKSVASANSLPSQLAALDWRAPWWQPWRALGRQVAQQVMAGARVCDALNHTLNARPARMPAQPQPAAIQFVPQSALPEGQAYEAFIFASGQVPTRENLHDFFNGLAWLLFPHTKRRLNSLQNSVLAETGVQSTRGALRDALTLFDENAALWPLQAATPNEVIDALRAKQWQRAFVELRHQWQPQCPVLFGHALLEKLVSPYKSITAHVYIAQAATQNVAFSALDSHTAEQLCATSLVPKPFLPLPVLGVPGWWAANQDPQFYADAQVFRPPAAAL